jgi:hypothetical protein
LIKVVVFAIPSYAMSSFMLPDGLCHQMDKAFKKIWWGFPKDKVHNLSLKSWKSLCSPKDHGGLSFRLMKNVNPSLISKLGWKLLSNHDSLWVLYSKTSISSMIIFYLLHLNMALEYGMVLRPLYLFYLLVLVLFLTFTRHYPYGLHLGFPPYRNFFLPLGFHLFHPIIHWL